MYDSRVIIYDHKMFIRLATDIIVSGSGWGGICENLSTDKVVCAFPPVWPDVGVKSCPNISKSGLKKQFLHQFIYFKQALESPIFFAYFCK